MVSDTFLILDAWYVESVSCASQERPKILSKIALLELCGWLENWMDDFVKELSHEKHCKEDFILLNVIRNNHGFSYSNNLRAMIVKVIGEYCASVIESWFESQHPGDLERLRNYLGKLKPLRNDFAHNQYNSQIISQAHFHAPSALVANFYNPLAYILENYRQTALSVRNQLMPD